MYGKALIFVILVVLGAVLPYLLADDQWMGRVRGLVGSDWVGAAAVNSDESNGADDGNAPFAALSGTTRSTGFAIPRTGGNNEIVGRTLELPRLIGPPDAPLEQLLTFEATPDWIVQQWSRVTTRLPVLRLHGYRVPYSAGSQPGDFAGSITYYFDGDENLQRIFLHGYTADPSPIIQLATTRFRMQRVRSVHSQLFTAEVEDQVLGVLRVRFANVVRSQSPDDRCEIMMELNRTGTTYGRSHEIDRILAVERLVDDMSEATEASANEKSPTEKSTADE